MHRDDMAKRRIPSCTLRECWGLAKSEAKDGAIFFPKEGRANEMATMLEYFPQTVARLLLENGLRPSGVSVVSA